MLQHNDPYLWDIRVGGISDTFARVREVLSKHSYFGWAIEASAREADGVYPYEFEFGRRRHH